MVKDASGKIVVNLFSSVLNSSSGGGGNGGGVSTTSKLVLPYQQYDPSTPTPIHIHIPL
jgi:hypothetical protein